MGKKYQIFTLKVLHYLYSLKYQVVISIFTLYSLFFDDFRTAVFEASADIYFDIIGLVIMGVFIIEIIVSCFVVNGYFLSFFFFLDVISTVSMVFDVSFINGYIFNTNVSSSITQLARQSKATRAATRAVRIIKLVRIIRIIKLYKNAEKAKEIRENGKKKQLLKEKMLKRAKLNES
jgi:signal transduction histidine kinase